MVAALVRVWTYDYLARLFDGDVEDLPESPDTAGSSPRVAAAAEAIRAAVAQASIDDVLADHARLFVNARLGVAAPPYASWYLDGLLLGPSSQWVERIYAEQGLERAPEAGEPADYLGAELEFLLFLARHELAAQGTGDDNSMRLVLDCEKTFVLSHVALWLPGFIAQVRAAGPGPVYSAACDVLWAVVQEDISRLSSVCSKPVASRWEP